MTTGIIATTGSEINQMFNYFKVVR